MCNKKQYKSLSSTRKIFQNTKQASILTVYHNCCHSRVREVSVMHLLIHIYYWNGAYTVFINQKVSCLQISVNNIILVQVVHPLADIKSKLEQHRKLQDVVMLMQQVIETSPTHVLCKKGS